MNSSKVCQLTILLTATTASLGAEVIRIHMVDGRNGKTITREQV